MKKHAALVNYCVTFKNSSLFKIILGMQAINTLKEILSSGEYTWATLQADGAITTSLTLQYSTSTKKISLALDELLDLRNRLVKQPFYQNINLLLIHS